MTNWAPMRIGGGGAANPDEGAANEDDDPTPHSDSVGRGNSGTDVYSSSINDVNHSYASAGAHFAGLKGPSGDVFSRRRLRQNLLFAFLFFASSLSLAKGVHEGYEKVYCYPDYFNATTVFDYSVKDLKGDAAPMNNHRGKILLIVNTATY